MIYESRVGLDFIVVVKTRKGARLTTNNVFHRIFYGKIFISYPKKMFSLLNHYFYEQFSTFPPWKTFYHLAKRLLFWKYLKRNVTFGNGFSQASVADRHVAGLCL